MQASTILEIRIERIERIRKRIAPVRRDGTVRMGERCFFGWQPKSLKRSPPLPFPAKDQLLSRPSEPHAVRVVAVSVCVCLLSVCVVVPQLPLPLFLPLWSGARGSKGNCVG
jgi:hypothetical protein